MNYIKFIVIIIIMLSILKRLFKKSDKSKELSLPETTVEQDEKKKEENPYVPLEQEKLEALFRKYNCTNEEDLILKLIEIKGEFGDLTEDEMVVYQNPEWDIYTSIGPLVVGIYNENERGKEMAIDELKNRCYQKNTDNPSKEFINYTLDYFQNKLSSDSEINNGDYEFTKKLIIQKFPKMHAYILDIVLNHPQISFEKRYFDYSEGFQEFIDFIVTHFREEYPEKVKRDEEIRKHFRIHHHEMIRVIDEKLL